MRLHLGEKYVVPKSVKDFWSTTKIYFSESK